MEPTQSNVFAALALFQGEVKPMELTADVSVATRTGGNYDFKYATLASIVETISPIMAKNGLGFFQTIKESNVITIITHKSGEFFESWLPFPMPKEKTLKDQTTVPLTAQEVGSWITYFRRYSLIAALGLVADDDDDGNHASGNSYESRKPQYKQTPRPQINAAPKSTSDLVLPPCRCGNNYVKRLNRAKGTSFYSCAGYPSCKAKPMDAEVAEQVALSYAAEQAKGVFSDGAPLPSPDDILPFN